MLSWSLKIHFFPLTNHDFFKISTWEQNSHKYTGRQKVQHRMNQESQKQNDDKHANKNKTNAINV